ncbi:MAG: transposase [Arcicella sp.]|jgi:REP element-mobilizing transposase RayT|nr:transposase [Arcicella sp.]
MKEFHERHLPHIQPLGGLFFVTYVLKGSIPKNVITQWQIEREIKKSIILKESVDIKNDLEKLGKLEFARQDKFLDTYTGGNHHLKNDSLAQIVVNTLHYWDNKRLELYAYTIMSNHVHVVFRLFDKHETIKPYYLQQIMHSIKLFSARECNRILGLSGAFWEEESYDRLVRNKDELKRILVYVLNNPVKAGLCDKMNDWKWSYIKPEYNDFW